jgi:hypothetical protein
MKQKPIRGLKTQTYWHGPTTIVSRSCQNSFTIISKEGETRAVHITQLKPNFVDVLEGGVPWHHYRRDTKDPASGTPLVDEILSHKTDQEGVLWFLVRWFGADSRDDTWNNIKELLEINDTRWTSYCARKGLTSIPLAALGFMASGVHLDG